MKDKWFFFGDYQGTRNDAGGSKLVTVPTAAARAGRPERVRRRTSTTRLAATRQTGRSSPATSSRASRLSPQALAVLNLIPLPNAPGTNNGTRDNYLASGSEKYNADAFNVRLDGRLSHS